MSAVASRRLRDGKPVVSGVGARLTKGGLRADVLFVSHPVRAGRLALLLMSGDGARRVTVRVPALEVGARADATLEVSE